MLLSELKVFHGTGAKPGAKLFDASKFKVTDVEDPGEYE